MKKDESYSERALTADDNSSVVSLEMLVDTFVASVPMDDDPLVAEGAGMLKTPE